MSTFDISTIEVADTFEVEIKHPKTDDPMIADGVPMTITVHGPASAQFKAAQAVQNTKLTKRLRTGKTDEDAEVAAADKAAFLSMCTVSLNGFNYKGQTEGREAFRALYLDPKMGWLTDQVNRQLADWSNFTQAAPGS